MRGCVLTVIVAPEMGEAPESVRVAAIVPLSVHITPGDHGQERCTWAASEVMSGARGSTHCTRRPSDTPACRASPSTTSTPTKRGLRPRRSLSLYLSLSR